MNKSILALAAVAILSSSAAFAAAPAPVATTQKTSIEKQEIKKEKGAKVEHHSMKKVEKKEDKKVK